MMPDVKITIKNLPQIKAAFNRAPMLMTRELSKAIALSVFEVGRGSRLNVSNKMVNVQTGQLRASHYERIGNLQGEVGTNTEYDIFVHEGTKFMSGRPYLRQAVEDSEEKIDKNFTHAVQNVLDAIGRAV